MGAIGAEDQDQMLHDRSHDQIIPGIPAENTLGTHQGESLYLYTLRNNAKRAQ